MALAIDTTALHIAGLFYAFALAPSVVTPLALALIAARTSYTRYRSRCATTQRTRNARKMQGPSAGPCARLHPSLRRNRTERLRAFKCVPFEPLVHHPSGERGMSSAFSYPALALRFDCGPGSLADRSRRPRHRIDRPEFGDPVPPSADPGGMMSGTRWRVCRCAVQQRYARPPCDRSQRGKILLQRASAKQEAIKVFTMIRKLKSGQYRLYSRKIDPKTGKRRNLGTFPTRAKAEQHERAVQYFKRRA
jgi:hypothetical protein